MFARVRGVSSLYQSIWRSVDKVPLCLTKGRVSPKCVSSLLSGGYNNATHCYFFHTVGSQFQSAESPQVKEEHDFQAETQMLLDIVAKSLYSDKEVFVRELVSNASDALEKLRYVNMQEGHEMPADLKILIETDKYKNTLTIQDLGIGLNKEELKNNLGVIARSGSKEFLQNFQKGEVNADNIIGQFGVGFYSSFMVANKVEVFTKSYKDDCPGFCWVSDGTGKYTIEEHDDITPGTKIVCHLKTSDREFSDETRIKDILKKYSSFVGFPIEVNGSQVNTIEPLWLQDPKSISPEKHIEFYRFIGPSFDNPRFTFHFQSDAPVSLKCLLYFPESKPGLFDGGKSTESGISLYSRRILIKNKVENLVPNWMRFVKGVVDSEDIPLNLSREMLQDSALIKKIKTVIKNKVIRFLVDKSRKDLENYQKFFRDYGIFLKEGIISSQEQFEKEELARLIMYESSGLDEGQTTSLAEYVQRMPSEQKDIYYLAAPSRELALSSPYYEALKKKNVEVLFCYESYDEVVLMQLREYNRKPLLSVEKEIRKSKDQVDYSTGERKLPQNEADDLMNWIKVTLGTKCHSIKATPHLDKHPCVITVEEMGAARHFIRTQFSKMPEESRYTMLQPQLEINPSHPIILKLNTLREENPRLAELTAKQLFYNGMVTAGLIEDPRLVLSSFNELLQLALEKH